MYLYGYVLNDSINSFDPSATIVFKAAATIGAGIGRYREQLAPTSPIPTRQRDDAVRLAGPLPTMLTATSRRWYEHLHVGRAESPRPVNPSRGDHQLTAKALDSGGQRRTRWNGDSLNSDGLEQDGRGQTTAPLRGIQEIARGVAPP